MSGTNPLPAGQAVIIPPLAAGTLAQANGGGSVGQGASNSRPLRGPPVAFMRQPYLGQTPSVQTAVGFGVGGGAGIQNNGSDADQSQGLVAIRVGAAPAASGNLQIFFPISPSPTTYVFFADWATLVPTNGPNQIILAWVATRLLIPGELLLLAYQWTVSN
jgi:hypothetical protein